MKLMLFLIISMFYTLLWYDTVYLYLFDILYIQLFYSACMDLFEYNK